MAPYRSSDRAAALVRSTRERLEVGERVTFLTEFKDSPRTIPMLLRIRPAANLFLASARRKFELSVLGSVFHGLKVIELRYSATNLHLEG